MQKHYMNANIARPHLNYKLKKKMYLHTSHTHKKHAQHNGLQEGKHTEQQVTVCLQSFNKLKQIVQPK